MQQLRKDRNRDNGYHFSINKLDNNVGCMILNGQDKEALVIDLLNKGHTAREIAKQAHVSFTYTVKIKRNSHLWLT